MKFTRCILILTFCLHSLAYGQPLFFPESGKYHLTLLDIVKDFKDKGINYISLKENEFNTSLTYKLNKKSNEYQVKNWYQRDWYVMQDMFYFNPVVYLERYHSTTFNEAKRREYAQFAFGRKSFIHFKTLPALKEWGGLTHPPIKKLTMPLEKYSSDFRKKEYSEIESDYFNPSLQLEIDKVSRSELSFGNQVSALVDHHSFLAKKRLIKQAKKNILMSSLVFICDQSTREITNLLIEKHRQGVMVKIIADGIVGKIFGFDKCLKMMSDAGIDVIKTGDFFAHKGKAIYHTKTLVTDLKEAIAGGQNMIDADNLSRSTDFMNRDVDLYVKGPMVTDIAKQFIENWEYQSKLKKIFIHSRISI